MFLTSVGSKAYHTLRALVQPAKPSEKTFADCVKALQKHFSPKPSEIVQRYRFYTCTQQMSENIAQFVANLRRLSNGCNFQDLNTMLRDRLVVGVKDATIQRKLLSESELTFSKAYNLATAMELAPKDLEDIRKIATPVDPPAPTVNEMGTAKTKVSSSNQKAQGSSTQKCWRCGGKNCENT